MHRTAFAVMALSVALLTPGCGLTLDFDPPDRVAVDAGDVDAARPDGGPVDGGGRDGGPQVECAGEPDGTVCGEERGIALRLICLGGACAPSVCGDGFVDEAGGELCDDGNEESNDGCEAFSCVPSCTDHADCDDGALCNGAETCSAGSTCTRGALPPETTTCIAEDGSTDGVCNGGTCAPFGCGDGMRDGSEECDDANSVSGDGCEGDCTLTCHDDGDCDDLDVCNGGERCTATMGCIRGTPVTCVPIDACHRARCDPTEGCVGRLVDEDGDGHAPIAAGTSDCGDDCNDLDPEVWATAPERCDGDDDDCDGVIDEDVTSVVCRPDDDLDGFGSDAISMSNCICPDGWTTIAGDCYDGTNPAAREVRPNQVAFSAMPYCAAAGDCGFDFDCDGTETPRWSATHMRCVFSASTRTCAGTGWDGSVPACGALGTFVDCSPGLGPTGTLLCDLSRTARRQQCR